MNRPFLLAEIGADRTDRLLAIADELRAIASGMDLSPGAPGPSARTALPTNPVTLARHIYTMRRQRDRLFGRSGLFEDPAWDILLDLFIAEAQGRRLSVTDACIGAAVPGTTALRWLEKLEAAGLVRRQADPADARRRFLRLMLAARAAMESWLVRLAEPAGAEPDAAQVRPASADQPERRPKAPAPA